MFANINNASVISWYVHHFIFFWYISVYRCIPLRFFKLGLLCQSLCVLVILVYVANIRPHCFTTTTMSKSVYPSFASKHLDFSQFDMWRMLSQYSFNLYFFYMREVECHFMCWKDTCRDVFHMNYLCLLSFFIFMFVLSLTLTRRLFLY